MKTYDEYNGFFDNSIYDPQKPFDEYLGWSASMALKDIGFREPTIFAHIKLSRWGYPVKNHSEITDSDYSILAKSNGGTYDDFFIYSSSLEITFSDKTNDELEGMNCQCPLISQGIDFLKKLGAEIKTYKCPVSELQPSQQISKWRVEIQYKDEKIRYAEKTYHGAAEYGIYVCATKIYREMKEEKFQRDHIANLYGDILK